MTDDLFGDYDAPLEVSQVRYLLQRVDAALADCSQPLPEQEVLRLWWGTSSSSSALSAAAGPMYGALVEWQEGQGTLAESRTLMRKQMGTLWEVAEGC